MRLESADPTKGATINETDEIKNIRVAFLTQTRIHTSNPLALVTKPAGSYAKVFGIA